MLSSAEGLPYTELGCRFTRWPCWLARGSQCKASKVVDSFIDSSKSRSNTYQERSGLFTGSTQATTYPVRAHGGRRDACKHAVLVPSPRCGQGAPNPTPLVDLLCRRPSYVPLLRRQAQEAHRTGLQPTYTPETAACHVALIVSPGTRLKCANSSIVDYPHTLVTNHSLAQLASARHHFR